jgi:hypothetical protein
VNAKNLHKPDGGTKLPKQDFGPTCLKTCLENLHMYVAFVSRCASKRVH